MSCALTTGYTLGCKDSRGGVKKLFLIERTSLTGYTQVSGIITAIGNTTPWREYELPRGNGSLVQSLEVQENGSILYKQSLSFSLRGMTTATRMELMRLIRNVVAAVVVDSNGRQWLCGLNFGMRVVSAEANTGKSALDLNGYTLTIEGYGREYAQETSVDFTGAVASCSFADSDGGVFTDSDGVEFADYCPAETPMGVFSSEFSIEFSI